MTCEGQLTPGLQGRELVLNFTGRDVPLEEELRNALSVRNPHIQQVWLDMQPRGVVDLTAEVRYLLEDKKFSVGVQVQAATRDHVDRAGAFPLSARPDSGRTGLSRRARRFQQCKGEHGPVNMPVKVAAEGYCDFQPDGRWQMHFENLSVDQIHADREL